MSHRSPYTVLVPVPVVQKSRTSLSISIILSILVYKWGSHLITPSSDSWQNLICPKVVAQEQVLIGHVHSLSVTGIRWFADAARAHVSKSSLTVQFSQYFSTHKSRWLS